MARRDAAPGGIEPGWDWARRDAAPGGMSPALRAELSAVLNRRPRHRPSRARGAPAPHRTHTTVRPREKEGNLRCLMLLYHFSAWEESWQIFISFPSNSQLPSLGQANSRDWFNWLTGFKTKSYEQCHFNRRLKPPAVLLGTAPWTSLYPRLSDLPTNKSRSKTTEQNQKNWFPLSNILSPREFLSQYSSCNQFLISQHFRASGFVEKSI